LLPLYDRTLGKPIHFDVLSGWPLVLALVGVAILVGVLAGIYPALVLSRFRPASTLRTNGPSQSGSGLLRSSLVVMQFAVSIGLGIAALVVFAQVFYARNMDIGFNKDGIVLVYAEGLAPSARQALVRMLDADPALRGATVSSNIPFSGPTGMGAIQVPGKPGSTAVFHFVDTGPDFFSVYRVRLLSGRPLSGARGQDMWPHYATEANILINRAAMERLGYSPQSALGKSVYDINSDGKRVRLTIVGVTADFMFEGDRNQIVPTIYSYDPHDALVSVRVPPGGVRRALSAIDRTWHRFAPSIAINRLFLDEIFQHQFQSDERQGGIFGIFVGIAIFIACLGLFGLAAFSTERRTKEIGLRKTYGARTKDVVLMLLWQFSIPVLIANLIAWPVAYFYLRNWLEGYAYRIALSPLYFIGAGAAALVIAWATVIVHAAHAARANPVHALRYE
jgi:putative ABC transport system permease protein